MGIRNTNLVHWDVSQERARNSWSWARASSRNSSRNSSHSSSACCDMRCCVDASESCKVLSIITITIQVDTSIKGELLCQVH